jgi:V/A-type H+-transporting ATPase subunit A
MTAINGKVRRISGPIVRVSGLDEAGLFDLVEVGEKRIIGEIVRLERDEAVIQVYEDDTGMMIGAGASSTGRPLSVLLGPGLIGTIYDGIQRPLEALFKQSGAFMESGAREEPLDTAKLWPFVPDPALAAKIAAGVKPVPMPGLVLGTVQETPSIVCKIMVPPGIHGEALTELVKAGDYNCNAVIARMDHGEEITLAQWWPVRIPRPSAKRLPQDQPLVTGQRVIDVFFPLSKGGTAAIPGGFGTGKTMTQHAVAKWCDADVIIYIG